MGILLCAARTMAAFRSSHAHEREFISIISELNRRGLFTLYGDKYTKEKGDKPLTGGDW
jgi:hypothetical protein